MKPFIYKEYEESLKNRSCFHTQHGPGEYWKSMWHYHDDHFEIIMPIGGCGECMVGDYHSSFEEGEIYLMSPGLPHNFYHLGEEENTQLTDRRTIRFQNDLTQRAAALMPELRGLDSLLTNAQHGLVFRGEGYKEISPLVDELTVRHNDGTIDSLILFLRILNGLGTFKGEPLASSFYRPPRTAGDVERIDVICTYLLAHSTEAITLKDVGATANMSVSNLCAFFRKSTGTSIINYVTQLRIGHACSLLTSTDLPILSIAHEVGFSTLSNFNRQFKKLKGVTPKQFRNRLG